MSEESEKRGRIFPHTEAKKSMTQKFCRVCSDFKDWLRDKSKTKAPETYTSLDQLKLIGDCPLGRQEIGRATWAFLHTAAAYYPRNPSKVDKMTMESFIRSFASIYPCEDCREDFQKEIRKEPPDLSSCEALSKWLCRQHNIVNKKIGKAEFDCDFVMERWRYGWKDGHCDG